MGITVEIEGLEALRAQLKEASDTLHDGMYSAVHEAADLGAKEARDTHPYTNRTYNLENKTVGRMLREDRQAGVYAGDIIAKPRYASYVNDGTSRSRPYPFMPQAERKARQVFDRIVDSTIARVLAIMSR